MTPKKAIRITDLILETGLTYSGISGADKIYSFAKLGASYVRDYISDQSEKKAYEFHRRLLLTNNGEINEELGSAQLDAADYHALLNACLADIEQEKSGLYGNLAKMIATNKVPSEIRRHFILKLKEMTWDQLDILANTYVVSTHRIMPRLGNYDLRTNEILDSKDPFSAKSMNVHYLSQNKFIAEETITKLGKQFIQSCYPQELLTPAAYNYREWADANYVMISLQEHDKKNSGDRKIYEYFREQGVSGDDGYREGLLKREAQIPLVKFVLVTLQNGKKLEAQPLANLERIASQKATLQIIFTKDPNEVAEPLTASIPYIAICEADRSNSGPLVYKKMACILRDRKAKND